MAEDSEPKRQGLSQSFHMPRVFLRVSETAPLTRVTGRTCARTRTGCFPRGARGGAARKPVPRRTWTFALVRPSQGTFADAGCVGKACGQRHPLDAEGGGKRQTRVAGGSASPPVFEGGSQVPFLRFIGPS